MIPMPENFDLTQAPELLEDIQNDLRRIERIYFQLLESILLLQGVGHSQVVYSKFVEATANELHGLYTGVEKVFTRIRRFYRRQDLAGAHFHKSVLEQTHHEIQLISTFSYDFLKELSGFRHLFRHAYGIELEPEKILTHAQLTKNHWPRLMSEIELF